MSSFLLKKKHMREALLFCFNLKKSAAESLRMLVEAYGDNVLSETTCRDWFRRFNDDKILTWMTRSVKISSGKLRTVNCRLFWTKTIPNRKKWLPRCFSSSHFHATCHGEDLKDRKMGAAWTDRQMERCQNTCQILLAKKESHSCIGLWQAMKSGSIFRILNARNLGLIPSNHQHLPQNQIASDERRCCVFGGIRRVSSTTSC